MPLLERNPILQIERSSFPEIKQRVKGIPVCLIIPDSDFLLDARVFPFIGILKIAAELERNSNPVWVLDLSKYRNQEEIVAEYIDRNPDVTTFGITATTPQIPAAVRIRNVIKAKKPGHESTIILGGPHASMSYRAAQEDLKSHGNTNEPGRGERALDRLRWLFDKIVIGDGELAIFQAIDQLEGRQIINAENRKDSLFLQRGELESFLPPARHLIDHESYHYYINDDGKSYRAFSVIGQLGCPYECGFCCGRDSDFLRLTRTRSIDAVIEEIEKVLQDSRDFNPPLRGVMFYDDELNVSPQNLENLCHALIDLQERLGIDMRFRGFVKANLFTQEQARLMHEAGFRVLLTGVESGDDTILRAMRKKTSREINSRCVEYAHNAGLRVKALMSIGHPGESRETIAQSVEWVLSNLQPGDDVDWTIITQYPGSPYYDRSLYIPEKDAWLYKVDINTANGQKALLLWSRDVDFVEEAEFYKGKPGDYTAYVWTDYLSPTELVNQRDKAERITRKVLNLPDLQSVAALQFEHSMGQTLPANILRQSGLIYQA